MRYVRPHRAAAAANLPRGTATELTVTVSRSNGFGGPITLSASPTATIGTVIALVRARATGLTDALAQVVIAVNP